MIKSRFKRAMLLIEIFFGHSASQARVFVQFPNPSSSIFDNIAFARRKASGLPLRQQVQLANFCRNEQHSRTILTCSYTSTATDTRSSIHSFVSDRFRDRDSVSILRSTCAYAYITTSLHNLVVCSTVYHQVFDDRGNQPNAKVQQ